VNELVLRTAQARLDSTFARFPLLPTSNLELQADFAKFLCVRVSGLVEFSFRHILSEFARRRSTPSVASFVERQLERLNAPNYEQMVSTLALFDPDWRNTVNGFSLGARRAALDAVVSVRHAIAHGENTGITYKTISEYYKLALEYLDFLEQLIL
jgi:hypothetical protein